MAAFLAMVLGPVALGAIFAGTMVATVSEDRTAERLELSAGALRTSVAALCGQLRTVAEAVASAPDPDRMRLATHLVDLGLATGVHIDHVNGGRTTRNAPPPPWAECAGPDPATSLDGVTSYEAVAARVPLSSGGSIAAAVTVDAALVQRLSGATGVEVTLLSGAGQAAPEPVQGDGSGDGTGDGYLVGAPLLAAGLPREAAGEDLPPVFSSLPGADATAVANFADQLADGGVGVSANGHLVRRLGPVGGQPLPFAVSLPAGSPTGTFTLLALIVLATAAAAVAAAWWLARAATAPLAALAGAADRVAGGDLQTRVSVRGRDEVARVAIAFNHMTRELHTYVSALTASRDQLRGQLGVLGDTLSSTHDLDRILQVILQTARHATGASAGVVLLTDPATGVLHGKCAEGLDAWDQLRIPVGQGLVGSVAATGVPRIGDVAQHGPNLDPREPDCRTYVVVPFSAPSLAEDRLGERGGAGAGLLAARGVLALYDRVGSGSSPDQFDQTDLVTLRTFAGQAAVAVDNVRVHEEAQRLSVTDSLTGLFNHRSLRDTLRRETDRAARFGRSLCVLALDLDRFKEINDQYGHGAGDAVLAEFARRIREEIREVDVAFRHGGEEFVVLLPETDEGGGIAVAERLGEAVRREPVLVPSRVDGAELTVPVTVSIGVAVLPDHAQHAAGVLQAADDALYSAKRAGRDTFRVAAVAVGADDGMSGSSGASSSPHAPRQARGR